MAKNKSQDVASPSDQPRRALLLEVRGEKVGEDGTSVSGSTEMFAALSMEEVIAYVRGQRPGVEIVELKVLGKVQVLSSSEHLE